MSLQTAVSWKSPTLEFLTPSLSHLSCPTKRLRIPNDAWWPLCQEPQVRCDPICRCDCKDVKKINENIYPPWSLELTVRTWKWMVGRWHFLLGWLIFRCYVSFRECTRPKFNIGTENSRIWKEIHFPNHQFWYPLVKFLACNVSKSLSIEFFQL